MGWTHRTPKISRPAGQDFGGGGGGAGRQNFGLGRGGECGLVIHSLRLQHGNVGLLSHMLSCTRVNVRYMQPYFERHIGENLQYPPTPSIVNLYPKRLKSISGTVASNAEGAGKWNPGKWVSLQQQGGRKICAILYLVPPVAFVVATKGATPKGQKGQWLVASKPVTTATISY